jgi:hypothetical protein
MRAGGGSTGVRCRLLQVCCLVVRAAAGANFDFELPPCPCSMHAAEATAHRLNFDDSSSVCVLAREHRTPQQKIPLPPKNHTTHTIISPSPWLLT